MHCAFGPAFLISLAAIAGHLRPAASAENPAVAPQVSQSNSAYAASFAANHVTNVFVTTQKTSCYRPEVPYFVSNGPSNGYSGMSYCVGANTGEDIGLEPYPTQAGSNPGYPATTSMLVKDHSESDLRVDPTNPSHLIGSSKWIVSAEGYNHLLGFYESFDGGGTWPVQGHIPGYEGWTDNTDPVGAFDGYGNYYELILPYMFFYNKDTTHNFTVGKSQEPNAILPAEVISVAVRRHGATGAAQWITSRNGQPDIVSLYDSKGREPDKQWITIDTNPASPNYNTIYVMWVVFNGPYGSKPFVSTAKALPGGAHTDWSAPRLLPTMHSTAADTYLLPHVDPSGVVYTTVANFPGKHRRSTANFGLDYSMDGGHTWQGPLDIATGVTISPLIYANTTFRSGIINTFVVAAQPVRGHYPLYVAYEEYSAGVANIAMTASYDGGRTWTTPIRANDNESPVDEFQPNLSAASNGVVSVAFYDRRLPCPASNTTEAADAGLALDTVNPNYTSALPPYGANNYCVNASIQFYRADLTPVGANIRLTEHTWDPELNGPQPGSAANRGYTFIGDYFGNTATASTNYSSFVDTYNVDNSNSQHYQQQVIATVPLP
jgi:hypothetical protein